MFKIFGAIIVVALFVVFFGALFLDFSVALDEMDDFEENKENF